jgi:hypothetical protein
VAVAALGAGAGDASADCGPDDQSAACQYVEDIPQSGGSQPSGGGPSGGGSGGSVSADGTASALTPAIRAKIESRGGRDARRLTDIATSRAYGAHAPTATGEDSAAGREALDDGSTLSAAARAVGGGDAPLLLVVGGIVLVSVAALALAARRWKSM